MKTIALCASISFYKEVVDIKKDLIKLGFNILMPHLAEIMEKENNFDKEHFFQKKYRPDPIKSKSEAIMRHFKKIAVSDAVLVVNREKNGIKGYIGGNVLMEMGIAFYLGKKIFVLNHYEENKSTNDEIEGIGSIVIEGDLGRINLYLRVPNAPCPSGIGCRSYMARVSNIFFNKSIGSPTIFV